MYTNGTAPGFLKNFKKTTIIILLLSILIVKLNFITSIHSFVSVGDNKIILYHLCILTLFYTFIFNIFFKKYITYPQTSSLYVYHHYYIIRIFIYFIILLFSLEIVISYFFKNPLSDYNYILSFIIVLFPVYIYTFFKKQSKMYFFLKKIHFTVFISCFALFFLQSYSYNYYNYSEFLENHYYVNYQYSIENNFFKKNKTTFNQPPKIWYLYNSGNYQLFLELYKHFYKNSLNIFMKY